MAASFGWCERMKDISCGRRWCLFLVLAFMGLGLPGSVFADETSTAGPAQDDASKKSAWRQLVDRQAAEYKIVVARDAQHPLGPPKPVLRWANPTRITHFESCTYLWTFRGRPAIVACIFSTHRPGDPLQFCHAFHSILREPLAVEKGGSRVWSPATSGIEFTSVPDAARPAESAAVRLREMKSLAAQFSATLVRWRDDGSDREELRLLPQPIFRYESEDSDVLDGGVFAFVQGTDPEALLLLEAVRKEESYRWHYGFVRRTSGILEARHRGRLVWTVPTAANRTDPRQAEIYFDVQPQR